MDRGYDPGRELRLENLPALLRDPKGRAKERLRRGRAEADENAWPNARHAEEQMARRLIQIDRKQCSMAQSPGEFRIDRKVEVWCLIRGQLMGGEAIKADQPIGLIKTMFPNEWRRLQGQLARRVRN